MKVIEDTKSTLSAFLGEIELIFVINHVLKSKEQLFWICESGMRNFHIEMREIDAFSPQA